MKRSLDFLSSYLSLRAGRKLRSLHSRCRASFCLAHRSRRRRSRKFPFHSRPSASIVFPGLSPRMRALQKSTASNSTRFLSALRPRYFNRCCRELRICRVRAGQLSSPTYFSGGDIIHVTAMVPRFTQSVMVKSEIKRPEDMAGKKIGVSRLGTVTHFALQTATRRLWRKKCHHSANGRTARSARRLGARVGGRRGFLAALQFSTKETRLQ